MNNSSSKQKSKSLNRSSPSSYSTIDSKWINFIQQLPESQRPVPIHDVKPCPGVVYHSYADYSNVPPPPQGFDNEHQQQQQQQHPLSSSRLIESMSFGQKVYDILRKEEYHHIISFLPHGRAFRIKSPKSLETQILPRYFGHGLTSTFHSDLLKHGFKPLTKGQDKNCKCDCYFLCLLCFAMWFQFLH